MLTGEPLPVRKAAGDVVIGAAMNGSAALRVRATKVGSDTALQQIVRLVHEARVSKAPLQRLADSASRYFVPIVLCIAVATFAVWLVAAPVESAPDRPGEFEFHCRMNTVRGTIVVKPAAARTGVIHRTTPCKS